MKAIIFLTLMSSLTISTTEAEANPPALYECFTLVRLRGEMDQIESQIFKTSKVFLAGSRVYNSVDGKDLVEVEFVASVRGLDLNRLRSTVSDSTVHDVFAATGVRTNNVTPQYLGCTEVPLQP